MDTRKIAFLLAFNSLFKYILSSCLSLGDAELKSNTKGLTALGIHLKYISFLMFADYGLGLTIESPIS
jgi:hypothetical protein